MERCSFDAVEFFSGVRDFTSIHLTTFTNIFLYVFKEIFVLSFSNEKVFLECKGNCYFFFLFSLEISHLWLEDQSMFIVYW